MLIIDNILFLVLFLFTVWSMNLKFWVHCFPISFMLASYYLCLFFIF